MQTLREKLVADFATIGTAIGEAKDQVLRLELMDNDVRSRKGVPVGYEFCKLLVVVFDTIYRRGEPKTSSAHSMTNGLFQKTVGRAFGMPAPSETITDIYAPENNYDLFLSGVKVEGDDVLVTVRQWVRYAPVETHEPKMEWVQVDETTRKLQPALDKHKKPITKKTSGEPKSERLDFTYRLPITFFVHLLGEINRDSLVTPVSKDYVPAPLGNSMSEMVQQFFSKMSPLMFHPKMVARAGGGRLMERQLDSGWEIGYPMPPSFGRNIPPFRLFLKPEPGSDRMEVVVEPYPEDEVRAHDTLQEQRRQWSYWKVNDTATFKAFEAELRHRMAEPAAEPAAK